MLRAIQIQVLMALISVLIGCKPSEVNTSGEETTGMEERSWQVPVHLRGLLEREERQRNRPPTQNELWVGLEDRSKLISEITKDETFTGIFEHGYGIPFADGAFVRYCPNRGELTVRHDAGRLDEMDQILQSLGPLDHDRIDEAIFRPMGAMLMDGGERFAGMATSQWHVSEEVIQAIRADTDSPSPESNPFFDASAPPAPPSHKTVREVFARAGVAFPEGASIEYDPETETITAVNNHFDSVRIEGLLLMYVVKVAEAQESP
ncbi:MAG: hypothetical protein R3242_02365 [Akkermansiaceae bacterium]|nr:hypothetical protein [Akkermansiaceae bacterium]